MDNWLIAQLKDNLITIWAILEILRGVAWLTPTVKDDKVITLLQGIYWGIKERKANKSTGVDNA
jgi:dsDNA-specific endonuclease/ATPase MutS2